MVENGIKPAYVFDGKPPELKSGVVRVVTLVDTTPPLKILGNSSYPSVSSDERKQKRLERKRKKPVSH